MLLYHGSKSGIQGNNREKGTSLANDICKNYRREGMFFDELLDAALKEG